jgi:hypothetical protein
MNRREFLCTTTAEKFTGNDEANKLLIRPLRASWTIEG